VHKGLSELRHTLDVAINRLVVAMVVAGGLIGSSLIGILAKSGPHVLGLHVISFVGFILAGVLGVWLLDGWETSASAAEEVTSAPGSSSSLAASCRGSTRAGSRPRWCRRGRGCCSRTSRMRRAHATTSPPSSRDC